MKNRFFLCLLALSLNALAVVDTIIHETWTNVQNPTTVMYNPTAQGDYFSTIPGADSYTISKMDASYKYWIQFFLNTIIKYF